MKSMSQAVITVNILIVPPWKYLILVSTTHSLASSSLSKHVLVISCTDSYIPYYVTVRAKNAAGYGPAAMGVNFTEEGSKQIQH